MEPRSPISPKPRAGFESGEFFKNDSDESDDEAPLVPRYLSTLLNSEEGDVLHGDEEDVFESPKEPSHPCAFAESNWFQLLSGVVIIMNLVVLTQEYLHPKLQDDVVFWGFNQVVLCFYVFELTVRLVYFQINFFISDDKWWNVMDLLIVLTGMLDDWIMPLVVLEDSSNGEGPQLQEDFTNFIRFLRVFRVLRLMKLFRLVLTVDLSWTESPWFQTLMGVVIAFNAVIMGLETDIHSESWWYVEQALLIIYVFELVVRLRRSGWMFFVDEEDMAWNWLDFLIVGSAIVDQWVLPVLLSEEGGAMKKVGQLIMLIRMFRLLRILRLVRLVRAIRPLYMLSQAVVEAMQSMFWVLILTAVGLYALAIPTTRIVGKSDLFSQNSTDPDIRVAQDMFGSIADSMFTLFGIMNGQEWSAISPLFAATSWFKPFFVVFTIYASWALLSVMTGVVSDSMFAVRTADYSTPNVEARKQLRVDLLELLQPAYEKSTRHSLHSLSHHRSPLLEREAFVTTCKSAGFREKLKKHTEVSPHEMILVFDMLDIDKTQRMHFDEFLQGFYYLNEPVTGKSLLQVEHEFRRRMMTVEAGLATSFKKLMSLIDGVEREGQEQAAEILRLLDSTPLKAK